MAPECVITSDIAGERHTRDWDRVIAELAESQHGRVARRQLVALGMREGAVDRRVERGRLRRTRHPGVYAAGHHIRSRKAAWMEAVLAAGPGAYLSHRAAGALWRILRSSRIELIVPRALRNRDGIRFHRHRLREDEVTIVDGIPVTTVSRTLFDLAGALSLHDLERAAHEADYLRLHDPLSLTDLLARYPGRRGTRTIRAILKAGNTGKHVSRREFEHRFLAVVDVAGLPRPEVNVWLEVAGTWLEVDCLFREQKLMVELDGWAAHGTKRAYERDRARDRFLIRHGWRVIRVTWEQLRDQPELIAADLEALLAYSA